MSLSSRFSHFMPYQWHFSKNMKIKSGFMCQKTVVRMMQDLGIKRNYSVLGCEINQNVTELLSHGSPLYQLCTDCMVFRKTSVFPKIRLQTTRHQRVFRVFGYSIPLDVRVMLPMVFCSQTHTVTDTDTHTHTLSESHTHIN